MIMDQAKVRFTAPAPAKMVLEAALATTLWHHRQM